MEFVIAFLFSCWQTKRWPVIISSCLSSPSNMLSVTWSPFLSPSEITPPPGPPSSCSRMKWLLCRLLYSSAWDIPCCPSDLACFLGSHAFSGFSLVLLSTLSGNCPSNDCLGVCAFYVFACPKCLYSTFTLFFNPFCFVFSIYLYVCMWAYEFMCSRACRDQKRTSPGAWCTGDCELPRRSWELNLVLCKNNKHS